jgi:hypothetical protein
VLLRAAIDLNSEAITEEDTSFRLRTAPQRYFDLRAADAAVLL